MLNGFFKILVLSIFFVSASSFAGVDNLIEKELNLKTSAEVWSNSVCLNDLVEGGWINSRCAVDRAMCCRWKMETGRVRTFSRAEIRAELSKIKIFGFALELNGPEEITVTQTRRELSANEVSAKYLAAVKAKFGDESSEISVEKSKLLGPIYISFTEENDWDVIIPESLTDTAPIKLVSTKDASKVLGWAQLTARIESEVYVAKQTIRPMDILKPEYFELRKVNIMTTQTQGQAVFRKNQFPEIVRARQTIMPGTALLATAVERIPMVKLGDAVTLILRSDSLRISTKGVVQGVAGVGDMVNVSLPRYNRTFRGRLSEGKLVEVWL